MAFSSWIRSWKRSLERRWALHQALRRQSVARHRAFRPRLESLEDRWLLSTTYTVTSGGDTNVSGTLRFGINQANNPANGITEIDFDVNGGGAQTIILTSALPTLTASGVYVNGLSQGGTGNTTPLVTLNGSGVLTKSDGLLLSGTGCQVSGLIIEDFTNNGIEVDGSNDTIGGTAPGAGNILSGNSGLGNTGAGVLINGGSGVLVEGNYIGTNTAGTAALANSVGVFVNGFNNTIGGSVAGAGNLISGNTTDGILINTNITGIAVLGNSIGTDVTGEHAIANVNGILDNGANSNTIGGTTAAARNIISGNTNNGILIGTSTGMVVQGNYIGTDVSGTKGVANNNGMVVQDNANTVGGTTTGEGNVISGNNNDGILITGKGSGVTVLGNYIGTNSAGAGAVANSVGVEIAASINTIGGATARDGNVISGNSNAGVLIDSGVSGVQVQGNYIGTDATGKNPVANSIGVLDEGTNDTIGGITGGARNIISGNSADGVSLLNSSAVLVAGNYIGTNLSGIKAVANSVGVLANGSSSTIGGTSSNFRNIISGNTNAGISIVSSGTQVQGNYIGTDLSGTQVVANSIGVETSAANNTIGGTASEAGNLLSGNTDDGVYITGSSGVQVQGNYIGTDALGTIGLGNSIGVEVDASGEVIGGTVSGAGNVISGNSNDGVYINASGVSVQGNSIGTDLTGTLAVANSVGVEVAGSTNTIGGTTAAVRNIISGNSNDGVLIDSTASGVQVQGNYIGTDVSGTTGVGNFIGVEVSGSTNTIGGTATGTRNFISGNSNDGVLINSTASGVQVQGNYIGTDVSGTLALGNGLDGVRDEGSTDAIGGTSAGAGNLISANRGVGVDLLNSSDALVAGNSIGINASGSAALGNGIGSNDGGIVADGSASTIGGTSAGARNIISGNVNYGISIQSTGTLVEGNYIGTDVSGSNAIANGTIGVLVLLTSGGTIGGTDIGAGNLISGNSGADGVFLDAASGVLLQGNSIGTDVTGASALGNLNGIEIGGGSGDTIGGATSAAANVISGNTGDGILIDKGSSGMLMQGNFIGTDLTGSKGVANNVGIEDNGTNDTLGGSVAGDGNYISGNSTDGVLLDNKASGATVQGNFIGTAASGTKGVANNIGVEVDGSTNTIGGTASAARNVISGNSDEGVRIDSGVSGVQVQGNYIGTDKTGNTAIANSVGVESFGSGNTVGGSVSGARNVISGNSSDGVLLDSSASGETVQGNFIGLNHEGLAALANSGNGIEVQGANNTIGGPSGTSSFYRNYISGNSNDGVLIDSGATGNQILGNFIGLDISGTNAVGNVANGVEIAGNGNTIGGTSSAYTNVISGNTVDGIMLDATSTANLIQGTYLGTDYTGKIAVGNSGNGIEVAGSGNSIGGTTTAARNIISGNKTDGVKIDNGATGTTLQGNYIGLNVSGTALGNSGNGVNVAGNNNTLGGTTSTARNIISGNSNDGVLIESSVSGVQVQGNYIGTDSSGANAIRNSIGVEVDGSNNTIGGTSSAMRNIISGNIKDGVLLGASGVAVQANYIGTDVTGTQALGNEDGVEVAISTNTIGGTANGAGNVISANSQDGILIDSGASGVQVQGNYIGTDESGTTAVVSSGNNGIEIAGTNNTIGGTTNSARNIISGNGDGVYDVGTGASGVVVEGNYVGTDFTGTKALGNQYGIDLSTGDTVGGTSAAARNIISGNTLAGVVIVTSGVTVQGNFIGTDVTGANAVANVVGVEYYFGTTNNTLGGTATGAGNLISGNSQEDVLIDNTDTGIVVQGNYIGTDATGTKAVAGNSYGVVVEGTAVTIGGTTSGARNVISGNTSAGLNIQASGVTVQGNYIGTDASGTKALSSGDGIDVYASNITIGGTGSGAGNVISGNSGEGVFIFSSATGVQVQGNRIGTDYTGTKAVANYIGILVGTSNNTIGGTTSGAGNVISGNTQYGVEIVYNGFNYFGSSVLVQGNYIGTDATGTNAVANGTGIDDQGLMDTIGGTTGGDSNTISGNTTYGVDLLGSSGTVQGNYIGTDHSGTTALGNSIGVADSGSNDTIGGTTTGAGNLISGNSNDGVLLGASSVTLQANYIGTDPTGTSAVGNSVGVEIQASNFTLGGTTAAGRNIISGNDGDGVLIDGGASGVQVIGTYIGTDVSGTKAVENHIGVLLTNTSNDTIGGTGTGTGNIISGNTYGVSISTNATGATVQGNYIGTDVTGTVAVANYIGVFVSGTSNNTIGGTATGTGNVISGNTYGVSIAPDASGVAVQGNYIGTDVTGATALGNNEGIDAEGSDCTIGGTATGSGNVISGNCCDGVRINGGTTGVLVQGNYVGTDLTGTKAVANSIGIEVVGDSNTLGGSVQAGRNIISGNTADGVLLDSGTSGNQVLGNYIGTELTGSTAVANSIGVEDGGTSNTVGGSVQAAGNLISGNSADGVLLDSTASGETVEGNNIGVNYSAKTALANGTNGVEVKGDGNTIGSTNQAAPNFISGNGQDGLLIDSGASGNVVLGNYVGVNYDGLAALHNGLGIEVAGTTNTIGGTATGSRNIVSGNTGDGMLLDASASGNLVLGNYVGINGSGTAALGNGVNGIELAGISNTLGGTAQPARNVISANGNDGVLIDSTASGNQLLGNYIGTDTSGMTALANKVGIEDAGNNNTLGGSVLGGRMIISGNTGDGVLLDSGAADETVQGNFMGLNQKGTAALANGGNGVEIKSNGHSVGGNSGSNYFVRNFMSGNGNDGILIDSGATGNSVQGNFIGLDLTGTNAIGNVANGIEIVGSSNTIGNATSANTNFISGNKKDGILLDSAAAGNVIEGNDVGTNYTGRGPTGNSVNGIEVLGTGNTLGGSVLGAGNVISGNSGDGVLIDSSASGTLLEGNTIGVNATGTTGTNGVYGVSIAGTNNTIGGTVYRAANIIAGNTKAGVLLGTAASGNLLLGNLIGVNVSGNGVANSVGVEVAGVSNTIGGVASGSRNIISDNSHDGVLLDSTASGNVVLGNYIGTNLYGTAALGNGSNGIEVSGNGNTLGGTVQAARNVISASGNDGVLLDSGASGNQLLGNYIGTDFSGTTILANQVGVEDAGNNNTLGGSVLGARNIISGNTDDGVVLDSDATAETVQGNFLGLNEQGTAALANGGNGLEVKGTNNTVGGSLYLERNFLSGNGNDGLSIDNGATDNQVLGNFVGLDITGKVNVGNTANGIEIASSNNTIGSTAANGGNYISGSGVDGLLLDSTATANVIQANFVGTDYTGRNALGNSGNGIQVIGVNNTLGGTTAGAGNVIAANGNNGVQIDSTASGTAVQGNYIGTDSAGDSLGNGSDGVSITGNNNTIGGNAYRAANTIANNSGDGVLVNTGTGNSLLRNSIYANSGSGISLTNGGNDNVAAPTLLSASSSSGTLTVTGNYTVATANVSYVLEFFANPAGDAEGKIYLGTLTLTPTSTGTQSFKFITSTTVTGTNPVITATITDPSGNTSAFSNGVSVV